MTNSRSRTQGGRRAALKPSQDSFDLSFSASIKAAGGAPRALGPGECQSRSSQRCRLCAAVSLEYGDELRLKNIALQQFWKSLRLPVALDELVASPRGRAYRTVTKRKVIAVGGKPRLGLIDPSDAGPVRPFEVLRCAIEPRDHQLLFSKAAEEILRPSAAPLATALRYVIVKGNDAELCVILNVSEISPPVAKAANAMSKALSKTGASVSGFFLYEDQSDGGYYLGSRNARARPHWKKIFGKSELHHQVLGRGFLYPPFVFSQVNHSILESLIGKAGELLRLTSGMHLFDLYCGYGLFSLSLANAVHGVTGIEHAPDAVAAAEANAQRLRVMNARFIQSEITGESAPRLLSRLGRRDAVLLDPPRGGTASGVLEWIAARRPARILHLFCNTDVMPGEFSRWTAAGYMPTRVIPFDMFPGTPTVEMMVLLEPMPASGKSG